MSNYVYGRNDRFYVAKQVSFDAIRNTGGAASLAAADACKHNTLTITPVRARLQPTDKEAGNALVYRDFSRPGRISATASVATPLFSGSAAGVAPDIAPILESAFGKVDVVADTSVTYSRLPSGLVTCELWGFNAAGVRGACAYGALVNRLQISCGGDWASLAADFICRAALTQDRFPSASTAEKGGLTAWPTEPLAQTYTGEALNGFTSQITLDGQVFNLRSADVTMNLNRQYDVNHCAVDGSEFFPLAPFELTPEILLNFSLWSTDAAALTTVLQKIASRTAFNASIQIGAAAGGTYTIPLNKLIIPDGSNGDGFRHEDGDERKAITVTGLRAQATSAAVTDEISLAIT